MSKGAYTRFADVPVGNIFKARQKTWIKLVEPKILSDGRKINAFEVSEDGIHVKLEKPAFFHDSSLVRCEVGTTETEVATVERRIVAFRART